MCGCVGVAVGVRHILHEPIKSEPKKSRILTDIELTVPVVWSIIVLNKAL